MIRADQGTPDTKKHVVDHFIARIRVHYIESSKHTLPHLIGIYLFAFDGVIMKNKIYPLLF